MKHTVSIILPVYNQAKYIAEVIESYLVALEKVFADFEILIIANGCLDNTVSICREISSTYPIVRVIELSQKGWGISVRTGIGASKGDVICYTNSARTKAVELKTLIEKALSAHSLKVVKAVRKQRRDWMRVVGSFLYNCECQLLFGFHGQDVNGTPKIFPRAFTGLCNLERNDDLIDLEFMTVCKENNYEIENVPIYCTDRYGGKSTTNFASAYKMYAGAMRFWCYKLRQGK